METPMDFISIASLRPESPVASVDGEKFQIQVGYGAVFGAGAKGNSGGLGENREFLPLFRGGMAA